MLISLWLQLKYTQFPMTLIDAQQYFFQWDYHHSMSIDWKIESRLKPKFEFKVPKTIRRWLCCHDVGVVGDVYASLKIAFRLLKCSHDRHLLQAPRLLEITKMASHSSVLYELLALQVTRHLHSLPPGALPRWTMVQSTCTGTAVFNFLTGLIVGIRTGRFGRLQMLLWWI